MYPNEEKIIVVPITKRMEIVMGIQLCLVSWMNFDCKENGGKKAFPTNLKHQYHVSQCGEIDYCTSDRRNGDYNKHQSLTHFTDGRYL